MDAETMTNEEAAQTLVDILQCTPNLRPKDEAALTLAVAALRAQAKAEAIDGAMVKLKKKVDKAENHREHYIACWMAVHEIDDALTRYKERTNG
jgi:ribosome-associated translation inhibitor RaiA